MEYQQFRRKIFGESISAVYFSSYFSQSQNSFRYQFLHVKMAKTSLAPPQSHHLRLHITYASVHHLRLNQLITCASHDLIPITARGILPLRRAAQRESSSSSSSSSSASSSSSCWSYLCLTRTSVLCAVPSVCVAKKIRARCDR